MAPNTSLIRQARRCPHAPSPFPLVLQPFGGGGASLGSGGTLSLPSLPSIPEPKRLSVPPPGREGVFCWPCFALPCPVP